MHAHAGLRTGIGGEDENLFPPRTGGEDHAMAATFDPGKVPSDWDVVGLVVEADAELGPLVLVDGHVWEGEQGWAHFR